MINYIIKALQMNDSVFVTDLGTFTKRYSSAHFEGKTLMPPRFMVDFDSNTEITEMAFINLVAREQQCLTIKASSDINDWVESLKNALSNNKSITFDKFGTFAYNNKGDITFECAYIAELNQEFEGMGELMLNNGKVIIENEHPKDSEPETSENEAQEVIVDSPMLDAATEIQPEESLINEATPETPTSEEPVVEELVKETVSEEAVMEVTSIVEPELDAANQVTIDTEVEEDNAVDKVTINTEVEEEEDYAGEVTIDTEVEKDEDEIQQAPKKKRRWGWILILILLLALAAAGYIFRKQVVFLFNQVKEKVTHKTEVVAEPAEAEAESTEFSDTEEIELAEEISEPEPYTPETIRNTADGKYSYINFESGHYYAIAGSFPTEKDAETHIRQYGLDKYDVKLVLQQGVTNIRICIGIFNTEDDATTFAKGINTHYWVLK